MNSSPLIDRMLESVGECFTDETAQRLARLALDPLIQERIDLLAERNTEGQLTAEEKAELESYVRLGNFIAILQAKARKRLRHHHQAA